MKIDKHLYKGYPKEGEERKYLVSFENLDILKVLRNYQVLEIEDCQETSEIRTRRVQEQYFRTKEELEEPITRQVYEESVKNIYHLYRVVPRTRYVFPDGIISSAILSGVSVDSFEGRGIFMMLDTFNTWNGFGILTVKGTGAAGLDLKLPGFEIVKDITGDKTYYTKSIATIDYTSFLE
ncbi:MAG: hypothetical protein MJ146_03545 [Clostridia bacterium]|nr:hypothetical protein [Clostridia bacterium]